MNVEWDDILLAIDGTPLQAGLPIQPVDLTARRAIIESLIGGRQDGLSGIDKLERYELAKHVQRAKDCTLERHEIDLIRRLSGDNLTVQAYGALSEWLDRMYAKVTTTDADQPAK